MIIFTLSIITIKANAQNSTSSNEFEDIEWKSFIEEYINISFEYPSSVTVFGEDESLNMASSMSTMNNDLSNFEKYIDLNHNIEIMYPLNWDRVESYNSPEGISIVQFLSPKENDNDQFQENINIELIDTSSLPNINPKTYIERDIQYFKDKRPNSKVIESSSTLLQGNPAYRLLEKFTSTIDQEEQQNLKIATIIDDKLYTISYNAKANKYDQYLPTIQKMITSIKFH